MRRQLVFASWAASSKGEQRGPGRRWFIEPESLAELVVARGGATNADARIESLETKINSLTSELQHLRRELEALRADPSDPASASGFEVLRRERDHYRAEASTLREAAIRANAGQRLLAEGFRKVLDAIEENADALSETLGPRSPDDVGGL